MNKDIYFIGGIHGVGKGTICKEIVKTHDVNHITASELLRWDEISSLGNKKVANIQNTQDRLLRAIMALPSCNYLLDGHFCLLNKDNIPKKIPIETFLAINPKVISVVTSDIGTIYDRIKQRDECNYEKMTLKLMQEMEIEYALEISHKLNVPFIEIKNDNPINLTKTLPKR
ncbi:MAG: AAA family ATPase [Labilibaculum sp.]|nr:ATP-binding protein [Labilibaculum sp.]MBI9056772.1 AAA family ATPase [Labilibaculum sp.]